MIEKNVASGINTTVVDATEVTKVIFERSGVVVADFYHVRNDGDTTAYASVTDSTLTADADGVMSIPSGGAVTVGKGLQIYAKGKVTIVSTSIASNPFKVGAKGGDGGNGYTKAEVDERLSVPIINATTLTGEGTTMATVDDVARVDSLGGKSTAEWGVVDLGSLEWGNTGVTSDSGGKVYFTNLPNKAYGVTNIVSDKYFVDNVPAANMALNSIRGHATENYIYLCINEGDEKSGKLYYEPSSQEYAQLINVTPTSVETSTGSSLSIEALTAKYFPTGMKSAGSVYDELDFENKVAIQRVGSVDLGTLNFVYNSTYKIMVDTTGISGIKKIANDTTIANIICSKYPTDSNTNVSNKDANGIALGGGIINLRIKDLAYDDPESFKSAMSGIYLNYELETPIITPITESIDPILDTTEGGTLTINVDNPISGVPYKVTEGYEYPIWRLVRQR